MTIQSIYDRFSIPPNLQEHMLRVTALAGIIAGRCKGIAVDMVKLTTACLLHDLGNIVKFDMEKYPQFLGAELARRDHWMGVQREMIARYGADDHEATAAMLKEIGISAEIRDLISFKSFFNAIAIADGGDWEQKIFLYADLRVAPFGIAPLGERLKELLERLEKYRGRTDLAEGGRRIEEQLKKICVPHVFADDDLKIVEARMPELRNFVISAN